MLLEGVRPPRVRCLAPEAMCLDQSCIMLAALPVRGPTRCAFCCASDVATGCSVMLRGACTVHE